MTKSDNCRHNNIHWEDLFKEQKSVSNKIHCLDCGETKGAMFAMATTRWYKKKIEDWLKDNGLAEKFENDGREGWFFHDWIKFLEKNNYKEVWDKFCRGKIDESYFDGFGDQVVIFEFAKSIEQLCREFKQEKQSTPQPTLSPKKKNKNNQESHLSNNNQSSNNNDSNGSNGNNDDNNNSPLPDNDNNNQNQSNQRQKEQIQEDITNLENKPNRTQQEEQELEKKKKELEKLNQKNNQNNEQQKDKSNWIKPVLIIGSVVLVTGLVIYLISKNKKANTNYGLRVLTRRLFVVKTFNYF